MKRLKSIEQHLYGQDELMGDYVNSDTYKTLNRMYEILSQLRLAIGLRVLAHLRLREGGKFHKVGQPIA